MNPTEQNNPPTPSEKGYPSEDGVSAPSQQQTSSTQPPSVAVPRVHISPISSEEDILREVSEGLRAADRYGDYKNDQYINPTSNHRGPVAEGESDRGLITEPISRIDRPPHTMPPSFSEDDPRKRRVGGLLGIIGGAIAAMATTVFVLPLFLSVGPVKSEDLIQAKAAQTTYSRPKQWRAIDNGGSQGYGDKRAKDGKSTAAVIVNRSSTPLPGGATESSYGYMRAQIRTQTTAETFMPIFNSIDMDCSVSDIQILNENDELKTATMTGLVTSTATCGEGDLVYKVRLRIAIGQDRYARTIIVAASATDWNDSGSAFEEMLMSVESVSQ